MNNIDYLNGAKETIKTERLKRIIKTSTSSSTDFTSTIKKRPCGKSRSKSRRK